MKNKNVSHEQEEHQLQQLMKEASKMESRNSISVSERETKNAYQTVTQKLGMHSQTASESASIFDRSQWHYAAAAAFILFAVGIAFLFTPLKITTGDNITRTVILPDQTAVTLNSNTILTYSRFFGWGERTVTLRGEAFFEVTENGKPFTVMTPDAQITVLGTKFNVQTNGTSKTVVYLKEGKVSFAPKNKPKQAVMLKPGQLSFISEQQIMPAPPQRVAQSRILSWLNESLSFQNKALSAIFDALERRFDVEIKVKSDEILDDKLTIYISNPKDAEQVLQDICGAKGLQYRRDGNSFTVFRE